MQLKLIKHYIGEYRRFLTSKEKEERLYIWESQRIFQEEWNEGAADWPAMYDAALQNSKTRRLWKREAYEPKDMMLKLITLQPEFAEQMFSDLFDESKSLEGRASRFVFYCDTLLEAYKEANPLKIENNHYHDDDYHMVFLYLSFRYPERYTLYDAEGFRRLLTKLGSTDVPETNDVERFARVMQTLHKFLQKEEDILKLHRKRLQEEKYYTGESLLLVYDFYQCIAQPWKGIKAFRP